MTTTTTKTLKISELSKEAPQRINFYEGSYLFKSETTSLNITESYLEYVLAKQHEYRPTEETLWCSVQDCKGSEVRFVLIFGVALSQVIAEI